MEVLNALIAEADRRAMLTLLPDRAVKCWASVYADDLVVFLHPRVPDEVPGCATLFFQARPHQRATTRRVAAHIPTWKDGLLTDAGRATLTQTTLSAIPNARLNLLQPVSVGY
jgi:hypothetical protein